MNIYIISNFNRKLDGETDGRFIYLAEILSRKGHMVTLVSSNFYHGDKCRRKSINQVKYRSKIVLCNEPGYRRNISIKRLISHYIFGCNVYNFMSEQVDVDVVYCAIPSLTQAYKMSHWCKKHKAKFVIDIQDLWPEAFCMIMKNKLLQTAFLPMKIIADKIYASADLVVGVSETYVQRALCVNNKNVKGINVCLGNSEKKFQIARDSYKLHRADNEIWLCYIGTLSYSYDIKCVIDALKIVRTSFEKTSNIKFIVVGDGPLKKSFEDYALDSHVNCLFYGLKPYEEMVGILCSCDIAINPIVKGSAASIINKVGDYALSGLPVINTQECQEYRNLITQYNCGINCECGNSEEVAEALLKLSHSPELRKKLGKNSLLLAKEKFDRQHTYNQIISQIENL